MEKEEALEIICMVADGLNPYDRNASLGDVPEIHPVTMKAVCTAIKSLLTQKDQKDIRKNYHSRNLAEMITFLDGDLKQKLMDAEKEFIINVLDEVDYDENKALESLGYSQEQFLNKVKEYGLKNTIYVNTYFTDVIEDYSALEDKLENLECQLLSDALTKSQNNKQLAAEYLNISYRSFRYRLNKHKCKIVPDGENKYLHLLRDTPIDEILGIVEFESIKRALSLSESNISQAAKRLGISFRSIRYRMKRFDFPNLEI